MFREILGLPAHVLLVHAAVVLTPLLALVSVAYAVLPRFRPKLDWAAALLTVAGPASAFLAKESGEQLEKALVAKHYPSAILEQVAEHEDYADLLFTSTFGLAVVTAVLLFVASGHPRARFLPSWVAPVLVVLVVLSALSTIGFVYLTGHTGAEAVWTGVL